MVLDRSSSSRRARLPASSSLTTVSTASPGFWIVVRPRDTKAWLVSVHSSRSEWPSASGTVPTSCPGSYLTLICSFSAHRSMSRVSSMSFAISVLGGLWAADEAARACRARNKAKQRSHVGGLARRGGNVRRFPLGCCLGSPGGTRETAGLPFILYAQICSFAYWLLLENRMGEVVRRTGRMLVC